jgi:8-oxo-dGTP pyrophosphatase MutT (NUDIX family)
MSLRVQTPKQYAGAILVNPQGSIFLQRRDHKPGVVDPGLLSIFAGAAYPGESKERACIREIKEETGLDITNVMTYFNRFQFEDSYSDIFIVKNVDFSEIKLGEGAGVECIKSYQEFNRIKDFTYKTRLILQAYFDSISLT